ncbi:MAG TPA: hypothetical protein VFF82_04360 [Rhodocyclaceae bacterium]|nr:hypothetical protein [Rhodocyclaceae bacterium]
MPVTEEIRARFAQHLGPEFAEAYPRQLEQQFPHVVEKIVRLWGSPDMEPFFDELLITTRTGRQGFPVEAAAEILRLVTVYRKLGLAVRQPKKGGDVWNWVDDVGYFESKRDD